MKTEHQAETNTSPTMETVPERKNDSPFVKNKGTQLTLKGLLIAFLILLLLIPTLFISNLIRERLEREEEVRNEVCSKWASEQILTGPILVIPYEDPVFNEKKEITGYKKTPIFFLPETLDISGDITPFKRHRSIFDITVYQSDLTFEGEFPAIDITSFGIPEENLKLNEAHIYFSLTDFRGIENQLIMNWDNNEAKLGNERTSVRTSDNGLTAPVRLTFEDLLNKHHFSLNLKLKGSESINFIPLGQTTTTHLISPWPDPSFVGNFLPNNPADISDNGFKANWSIYYLNRNFPQYWTGNLLDFSNSTYGVKLLKSTDSYAKTTRSVKYAILFIALTFALYFFIEILQNRKVHPLQYILVGMALCIFYILLLSISEYISFNWAYLIAASATVILITLYTHSAFRKWGVSLLFGSAISGLYGFIFILIQLQDGALLFGSIGLFILLAVIMYYSRKIDWYGQQNEKKIS